MTNGTEFDVVCLGGGVAAEASVEEFAAENPSLAGASALRRSGEPELRGHIHQIRE